MTICKSVFGGALHILGIRLMQRKRGERVSRSKAKISSKAVFGSQNQNSKKNFRHLHGDLNLDEIKNALRLLSVNSETNLMSLIRL